MPNMEIFITSSWKNRHAVEMLTDLIREKGHKVHSFIENAPSCERRIHIEKIHTSKRNIMSTDRSGLEGCINIKDDGEQWINSISGGGKFKYDLDQVTKVDVVVYLGPSGLDGWAEIGAAWGSGVKILGLWSAGDQIGLMRHMVEWCDNYKDLLKKIGPTKPCS